MEVKREQSVEVYSTEFEGTNSTVRITAKSNSFKADATRVTVNIKSFTDKGMIFDGEITFFKSDFYNIVAGLKLISDYMGDDKS
jgi:hypothetical protein